MAADDQGGDAAAATIDDLRVVLAHAIRLAVALGLVPESKLIETIANRLERFQHRGAELHHKDKRNG